MIRAVGSRKDLHELPFYTCISDIYENKEIQKLDNFTHHIYTTRLQHSLNVAYYNYIVCNFFHWNAVSAARAGLLHDMYYYETKEYSKEENGKKSHLSTHPEVAVENAKEIFYIDPLEADIIEKHMWPMSIRNMPKYKESYVIVFVDKYCAVLEFFAPKYRKLKRKLFKSKFV